MYEAFVRDYQSELFREITFPWMSIMSAKGLTARYHTYVATSYPCSSPSISSMIFLTSLCRTNIALPPTNLSAFGDDQIEDLWLPYFCVSTNIASKEDFLHIHTSGNLWHAALSSSRVPIFWPPIQAAPGQILVDGGFVNNNPVDIMRRDYGANIIISSDVGEASNIPDMHKHTWVNGTKILFDSIFRRRSYPTMIGVVSQLMALVDVDRSRMRMKLVDVLINPDITGFDRTDFGQKALEELTRIGYAAGRNALAQLKVAHPDIYHATVDKTKYLTSFWKGPAPVRVRKRRLEYLIQFLFNKKVIIILLLLYVGMMAYSGFSRVFNFVMMSFGNIRLGFRRALGRYLSVAYAQERISTIYRKYLK